jgi:hypothetical protein
MPRASPKAPTVWSETPQPGHLRKSGRETQRSLFCSGGQGPPVVAGLCMSCYQGVTQKLNPGFWHQLEISGLIGISGAER